MDTKKYFKWQQKYIDLMAEKPHNCAVEIIGELERAIEAKDEMLVAYRMGRKLKEKTHNALQRGKSLTMSKI